MKLKRLNISDLSWDSSILELSPTKKPSQSLLKIYDAGIEKIQDLIWVFPLRLQKMPQLSSFDQMQETELFLGRGKIINIKFTPAFGRKGKGKVQLFNATVVVKDSLGSQYINLKWFNSYPGLKKQLEKMEEFIFMGEVQSYKGVLQIINPKINPKTDGSNFLIEYPTVNSVPGSYIKKVIERIPRQLWDKKFNLCPHQIVKVLSLPALNEHFKTLHGLGKTQFVKDEISTDIIYEEFLNDQLKVAARKIKNKKLKATRFTVTNEELESYKDLFPYTLTPDQKKSLNDVRHDLSSGHPMMRMLQGDVGCGKTTIAIIASLMVIRNKGQVALMCPTEALAQQHFKTIINLIPKTYSIELLLGSTKSKEKKSIYQKLSQGEVQLIIGTHSLFQDSVSFQNLQLAIIDEQHKFGVEQRQKLVNKGEGTHSLIMSATPIPRTLQLAQYGDLDISTIRSIPANRKGIQTRIITKENYEKYLSFLKTRVALGEQAYIVVPAISESQDLDLKNVDEHIKTYKKIFPDLNIHALHGQQKPIQKKETLELFNQAKVDILISTSVIEVGINVINATVMSIYGPERFGLSSLHQLRGRVGRAEKPGFCFLVTDKNISQESMDRLEVIEKSTDGFEIAEADLRHRGQGDLFGVNQSGNISSTRLANIFRHREIFDKVIKDIDHLNDHSPQLIAQLTDDLIQDTKVSSTI